MGKPDGFMQYPRKVASKREVEQRLKDYKEISLPLTNDQLSQQGARCMDCGIPYCHAMGCPVFNLIPEWNDAIYNGHWREAFERLDLTNNLPEITGRVCPAPCEAACTLSINSSPVTIEQIELAIIENAFAEGWVVPKPPKAESGKRVAVIGSGPAGISAAQWLRRVGHKVTLFEKWDKIGGILRYGIPDFKLEKWVLDRRLEQLRAEGVEFRTSCNVGIDVTAEELRKNYEVILLTMGAGKARDLLVPGRELQGIYLAMDYLTQSNKFVAGLIPEDALITAQGKTVLVIGGGDTGSDCVGTANRQSAKKVYQIEILPKPLDWKESWNPEWPYWPRILRTSTSHDEGCERGWSVTTKEFKGIDGIVKEARLAIVTWEFPAGKPPLMKEVPGSEYSLEVDLVLLAMGFVHVEHNQFLKDLGVQFDPRGNVLTNDRYQTNIQGVFAAGDTVRGASLVVHAINQGRQAAQSIDTYLSETLPQ